jgi:hypothetical protein
MTVLINILIIVFGVALASFGEIQFSIIGFLYQLGGTISEAIRLVMVQMLLSGKESDAEPQQERGEYVEIQMEDATDGDEAEKGMIGVQEGQNSRTLDGPTRFPILLRPSLRGYQPPRSYYLRNADLRSQ